VNNEGYDDAMLRFMLNVFFWECDNTACERPIQLN